MNELQLILPLFLLLGSTISLWLASQAWKHRPEPWAPLLTLLMVTISWWSLFNAFELNSFRLEQKLFWINVQYIGIALLPVAFWAFAMAYSGRTVWLSGRRLPLMLLIPFLTIIISWTNIGQLMRTDIALQEVAGIPVFRSVRGPWFGVYLTYTYVLLLWGVGLLIGQWRQATAKWRKNQAAVLVLACLIPIVASIMTQFAVVPFELSTFAFLITGLLISWGMFRLRLFDIAPIARRIMTSSMSDGMIALDHHGRIVDANLAALNVLGRSLDNVIGRTLDEMLDGNTLNLDVGSQMGSGEYELILEQKDNKHYYDVRISPLKDIWRQFQGNLVVLRDVTSQRKSSQDLLKQKRLLEQLVLVARITTEKADLQNTLLNTLTVMASLTESHAGSLLLLDKRLQITHCLYSDESHQSVVISPEQFPHRVVKEGLAGWVIREKECALVHDTAVDERWIVLESDGFTPGSAVSVPITHMDSVLGVLTLTHLQTHHFTDTQLILLQASADQIALALRNASLYEEQKQQTRRQRILYQLIQTIGEYLEPQVVMEMAVKTTAELAYWSHLAILTPNEQYDRLVIRAATGDLIPKIGSTVSITNNPLGMAYLDAQTAVLSGYNLLDDGPPAVLAVPLRKQSELFGFLIVLDDDEEVFNEEVILLAESISEAIALAINNAEAHKSLERYAKHFNMLYDATRTLSQLFDLNTILQETLHAALTFTSFDGGVITLYDDQKRQLSMVADRGLTQSVIKEMRYSNLKGTICEYVFTAGEMIFIPDISAQNDTLVQKIASYSPTAIQSIASIGMKSYSGMPLAYKGKVYGSLCLFARQPKPILGDEITLQRAIAQQAAVMVDNATLLEDISHKRGQLLAFIESSRDGLILVSTEDEVLVVNQMAIKLLQLPPAHECYERPFSDLLDLITASVPDMATLYEQIIESSRDTTESLPTIEYELANHAVLATASLVSDSEKTIGYLLVLRDVTEERTTAQMRDSLTRMMVHDLRNPISAAYTITDFLRVLLASRLEPNEKDLMEQLRASITNTLQMVNSILDISRLESGRMPLKHVEIALNDTVDHLLRSQSSLAQEKNIKLKNEVPFDLPLVWADQRLIERVLQNLLDNAIKFTRVDGQVTVAADIYQTDNQQPKVQVTISDSGFGIPEEVRGRLFQKFSTGDQLEKGSGLGLAFCRMVLEAHQESIWLVESSNQGAVFSFSLPISAREVAVLALDAVVE